MSYVPSHDHMLEATLAHTGLDDLKLCGQRQHTHATVAVAALSSYEFGGFRGNTCL